MPSTSIKAESEAESEAEAKADAEAEAKAAYTLDWRGKYPSDALAVVRPDSTAMVADVVRLCARHDVAITPQGGNTGLVGGSVPTQPRREIVLSLERMSAVEDVDAVGNTMLVQTGCILAHAQQAAEAENRLFPLSLGAPEVFRTRPTATRRPQRRR